MLAVNPTKATPADAGSNSLIYVAQEEMLRIRCSEQECSNSHNVTPLAVRAVSGIE